MSSKLALESWQRFIRRVQYRDSCRILVERVRRHRKYLETKMIEELKQKRQALIRLRGGLKKVRFTVSKEDKEATAAWNKKAREEMEQNKAMRKKKQVEKRRELAAAEAKASSARINAKRSEHAKFVSDMDHAVVEYVLQFSTQTRDKVMLEEGSNTDIEGKVIEALTAGEKTKRDELEEAIIKEVAGTNVLPDKVLEMQDLFDKVFEMVLEIIREDMISRQAREVEKSKNNPAVSKDGPEHTVKNGGTDDAITHGSNEGDTIDEHYPIPSPADRHDGSTSIVQEKGSKRKQSATRKKTKKRHRRARKRKSMQEKSGQAYKRYLARRLKQALWKQKQKKRRQQVYLCMSKKLKAVLDDHARELAHAHGLAHGSTSSLQVPAPFIESYKPIIQVLSSFMVGYGVLEYV